MSLNYWTQKNKIIIALTNSTFKSERISKSWCKTERARSKVMFQRVNTEYSMIHFSPGHHSAKCKEYQSNPVGFSRQIQTVCFCFFERFHRVSCSLDPRKTSAILFFSKKKRFLLVLSPSGLSYSLYSTVSVRNMFPSRSLSDKCTRLQFRSLSNGTSAMLDLGRYPRLGTHPSTQYLSGNGALPLAEPASAPSGSFWVLLRRRCQADTTGVLFN